jgi:hypothetical protein
LPGGRRFRAARPRSPELRQGREAEGHDGKADPT